MKEIKIPIKRFYVQVILLIVAMIATACSSEKGKSKELEEAFRIHKEAVKVREDVNKRFEKLNALTDSSFVATYQISLDSINESVKSWDEKLVEVPGFEHDHSHDHEHEHEHGHDHDHNHGPDLTPQQHLEVQQYLLEEIRNINQKLEEIPE